MDDVMQIAQERAERPKTAPIGSGFESERQRSKNALVRQIDSLDGRNVRMIAAAGATPEEDRILRVAAYCRVSTESEEQATSYEAQVEHYTDFIKKNPEWEFAGIYADDGISGTNTKKGASRSVLSKRR